MSKSDDSKKGAEEQSEKVKAEGVEAEEALESADELEGEDLDSVSGGMAMFGDWMSNDKPQISGLRDKLQRPTNKAMFGDWMMDPATTNLKDPTKK